MENPVLDIADEGGRNRVVVHVAGRDFGHIKEVGIRTKSTLSRPDLWVVSDELRTARDIEKRNLINAKIKAIIGTAVMAAAFAITLGALIAVLSKK